ncbi:15729_t:CDS:2, partial [Acaulospora colombiana]
IFRLFAESKRNITPSPPTSPSRRPLSFKLVDTNQRLYDSARSLFLFILNLDRERLTQTGRTGYNRSWETGPTDDVVEPRSSSKKARYDIEGPEGKTDEILPAVDLITATKHQKILDQLPAGAIFELARVYISQGKDTSELDVKWLLSLQTAHKDCLPLIAKLAGHSL